MRFLANENFPLAGIILLRTAGQDVVAVIQETPGARDPEYCNVQPLMHG